MENENKTSILNAAPSIMGAAQWASNLLGIGQKRAMRQQVEQQGRLNEINAKTAKELADYEQKLKMDFRASDLGARLKSAEENGVSRVAILGGSMSPGQGATVSPISGGSAANAAEMTNAQTNKAMAAAQLGLMTAQTANINADTKQKEAGAANLGADTAKKGVETAGGRLENEMKKIDLLTKGMTQQTTIEGMRADVEKTYSEIVKLNAEGLKGQNEAQFLQQTFTSRVAQTLQNAVKLSGEIELNKAQARYLAEQIKVEYKKLDFAKMSLDQQKQIVADTLNTMIEGKWIEAGSRVVGDLINLIPSVKGIFGKVENLVETTETDSYDAEGNHTGSRRTTRSSNRNTQGTSRTGRGR